MGVEFRLIFWVVVLIALVIAAGVGLLVYRRKMLEDDRSSQGPALTLHDLREHHRKGRMTDAEFEAAKAAIIGQAKRSVTKSAASGKNPNKPVG